MLFVPRSQIAALCPGAGGGAVTGILDGVSGVTAAWSAGRDLLTAFIGNSRYTDAGGGATSAIIDQTLNSRSLSDGGTSARRPTFSTAGLNSVACLDFNGSTNSLSSAGAASAFVTASAGYMLMSFIIDDVTANDGAPYANEPIIGDTGGFMGIYIRNTAGSPETAQAFIWNGGIKVANDASITVGDAHVVEWWIDSGLLYVCVNNGTPQSVATGSIDSLAGSLNLGQGYSGNGNFFDGKFFEGFTATAVPASRATYLPNFMSWSGAV